MARVDTDLANKYFGTSGLVGEGGLVRLQDGKVYRKKGLPNSPSNLLRLTPIASPPASANIVDAPFSGQQINMIGGLAPEGPLAPETPPGGRIFFDPAGNPVISRGPAQTTADFFAGLPIGIARPPVAGKEAGTQPARSETDLQELAKNFKGLTDSIALADTGEVVKVRKSGVVEQVALGTDRPIPPSFASKFEAQRQASGVVSAEEELSSAQNDLAALENEILTKAERIKGERVSTVVIGRKLTQLDADTANALRETRNRVQAAQTKLENRNKTLSTLMTLTREDYQNTRSAYNDAFSQQMQMFNAIQGEVNRERDDARANLNIILKVLQDTGKTFTELPDDLRFTIESLETQGGMPVGFSEFVSNNISPEEKVITTGSRTDTKGNEYFDVLIRGADGAPKVTSYFRGVGGKKETITEIEKSEMLTATNIVVKKMEGVADNAGKVSPENWNAAKKAWVQTNLKASEFDDRFRFYIDPDKESEYQTQKPFLISG